MIKLVNNTITQEQLDTLADWIKTDPKLTKGELTVELEKKFAKWLGTRYAVFVNSGSSANLIMLYALIANNDLRIGDKVIVPALSWATDLAPVIQFGLEPILCDCNFKDLSVSLGHLEYIMKTEQPKVLLLVSVLGLVPNMAAIQELCKQYNVILLEDNCESLGSEYENQKLGTFGVMSTTSMYYGHHISTIEGGMIFTDSEVYYNILLSLRSHGWSRDWSDEYRKNEELKWNIEPKNSLYSFYYPGFNVRATDLQAKLGLMQLDILPQIIEKRNKNFNYYMNSSLPWKPVSTNYYVSSFAFPLITTKADKILEELFNNGIEARPLISGSLSKHPVWLKLHKGAEVFNAEYIHKNGLYIPNHPGLSDTDLNRIIETVNSV